MSSIREFSCEVCGRTFSLALRGRPPKACSAACRHELVLRGLRRYRAAHLDRLRAYDRARGRRPSRPDPVKAKARRRRWYEKNLDLTKRRTREWAAAHPEQAAAKSLAWARAHPEYMRFARKRNRTERRARIRLGGRHSLQEWTEKLELFAHCCAYCGRSDVRLEPDHRIPLSRGGSDLISNIVPACRSCNARKNAKTDVEFIAARKVA